MEKTDKVTYGDILPVIKQDLDGEGLYEILDIGAVTKKMAGYQVCKVGSVGMDIDPDCTYKEWARVINQLDAFAYGATVRDCLMKWYIGDAINAGEELFGEKASQIFGPEQHWTMGYINNIRYVCRNVPKDLRTLKINHWQFWTLMASMQREDQEFMINKALEILHYRDWYDQIKKLAKQDKVLELAAAVEDEEFKEELLDRIKTYKPTYHVAKSWIDRKRLPRPRMCLSDWVAENTPEGTPDDVKPMIFNMCCRLVDAMNRDEISNS